MRRAERDPERDRRAPKQGLRPICSDPTCWKPAVTYKIYRLRPV